MLISVFSNGFLSPIMEWTYHKHQSKKYPILMFFHYLFLLEYERSFLTKAIVDLMIHEGMNRYIDYGTLDCVFLLIQSKH
jgi:hypothetical protein